jgi:PIF1-like helicase/Helitron helicase-like domain at N-terminus
MPQQRFKSTTYRFQPYNSFDRYNLPDTRTSIISSQSNLQDNNSDSHSSENFQNSLDLNVTPLPIWQPSTRLKNLHTRFKNTILCEHICLPCVFCGKLLYPTKAKWIPYNENFTYPLEINFQTIDVYIRGEGSSRTTCVCESCKNNQKRYPCPKLHPIPDEINAIPITQRRFLSPVFLHCSLGRNLDANRYTEYRTLEGDMQFSKNMRALKLYSGILGAFLTNPENQNNNNNLSWLTPQLCTAARWLKHHNKYLRPYSRLISASSLLSETYQDTFPTAMHLPSDTNAPPFQEGDIILSSADFSTEVHNEDFHYTHLMAGFVQTPTTTLPLSFDNPDLEALIFPDIFPDGNGHFSTQNINNSEDDSTKVETYGKYIKHRLLCADPRFRLHPYWPHYSYLRLEKLRNHQNTTRIWRQRQADRTLRPPTASELITRSVYSGKRMIDETKTITLPSFIRTGETYFNEKLLHINAMMREYNLPSLFITLTAAETKWSHLKDILKSTDNKDTNPTNRPLHTTHHFTHRKKELWNRVWRQPANSNWGHLNHFFERVEFQNRGAPHTHTILWVEKSIPEMIEENLIRSDLPDPNTEPELYQLVLSHQIHTCSPGKCGGPAPPGQVCKKKFPRPYSPITYYDAEQSRYVYRCVNERDRWVVPYHAPTLLIWNAHMNIQYVSSKNLGKYLTKYVVKSEPTHVFNISEGDKYREHIVARRLSSMECMFLLLGETICNSSVQVKYLPTEPPTTRSRAIRPISTISDDEEDPYWKDLIEKYFARPHTDEFNHITYPNYFKNYTLSTKRPSNNRTIYQDELNYYVTKRSTPLVTRYRHLKVQNGESFFYQQLLLTTPCRSERELLGNYTSYREKYLSLHPDFQSSIHNTTDMSETEHRHSLENQFNTIITQIIETLANIITPQIAEILTKQLDALKLTPPIFPENAMLHLPEEQYILYNTIVSNLGPLQSRKYPFFFITGSGGTGKTYITRLIIDWINSQNKTYLLTAPTGVAAQNIGGQTIHSALRLTQSGSGYQSLAFYDLEFKKKLQSIQILIIEEISMVSAALFNFISNLFARIHNSDIAFGGICVIAVGDLAQLPPVRGDYVFYSSIWQLFYPLFLHKPQRHQEDEEFYQMLEEIRFGTISDATWSKLVEKATNYNNDQSPDSLLTTTHIVGYCETSKQINNTICNTLPVNGDKFLIAESIDFLEGKRVPPEHTQSQFKLKTNMPPIIRLQQGARVMYLNNSLINDGICNGTIGVVTDINKQQPSVQVAFCTHGAINHRWIARDTTYFYSNGQHASRTQFPLQNSFSLTTHKTQSLTLPSATIDLSQMFAPGQAYTAISRCPKWNHIQITNLNRSSFMVDPDVIKEYARLKQIASQPLPIS